VCGELLISVENQQFATHTFVAMVETADLRNCDHLPSGGRMNWTRSRALLQQRQIEEREKGRVRSAREDRRGLEGGVLCRTQIVGFGIPKKGRDHSDAETRQNKGQ